MPSPLLWGPGTSTNLQPGIQFTGTGSTILSGAIDPTSVATAGLPGSLFMSTSTGLVYVKADSGTTTNWNPSVSITASITEWQSYTPTFGNLGSVSGINIQWRQVGSNLEVRGNFIVGTPGAGTATMSLPSGLTTSSALSSSSLGGVGVTDATGVTSLYVINGQTDTNFYFSNQNGGAAGFNRQIANAMFNAGSTFSFFTSVRIQGWTAFAVPTSAASVLNTPSTVVLRDSNSAFNSQALPSTQITTVTSASSPYTIGTGDYLIYVDTSAGPVTLNAPNPSLYRTFKIKDIKGTFGTNNCTLARFGSENIEGLAANYVMQSSGGNYEFAPDTGGINYFKTSASTNPASQSFPSSGTFTPKAGVYNVSVMGRGASGGGGGGAAGSGGSTTTAAAGGGGGGAGGATISSLINGLSVTPGTGITVTVGAAGTAGAGGVHVAANAAGSAASGGTAATSGGGGSGTTFGSLWRWNGARGGGAGGAGAAFGTAGTAGATAANMFMGNSGLGAPGGAANVAPGAAATTTTGSSPYSTTDRTNAGSGGGAGGVGGGGGGGGGGAAMGGDFGSTTSTIGVGGNGGASGANGSNGVAGVAGTAGAGGGGGGAGGGGGLLASTGSIGGDGAAGAAGTNGNLIVYWNE